MRFTPEYLERLKNIQNPSVDYEEGDVCDEYEQIRHYAQSLLSNPKDEESRKGLSELIKRTEIILK